MYSQTVLTAGAVFILGAILMVLVPGVFGVWSIAAVPITTASALIFFGLSAENIVGMMLASVFLEMFAGLPLGTYPASVAIAALVLMLAGNIIRTESLKSLSKLEPSQIAGALAVAYVLTVVILVVSYLIMALAYGYGWSWSAMTRELFNIGVFTKTILGILFSWACWHGIQHLVSFRRDKW